MFVILKKSKVIGPFLTLELAETYGETLGTAIKIVPMMPVVGGVQELVETARIGLVKGSRILKTMTRPEDTKPSDTEFLRVSVELMEIASSLDVSVDVLDM